MAKSTKVSITLPPASYALLQQAALTNGINEAAAASLILQAALTRRISALAPKRPGKSGTGSRQASGTPIADSGRPVVEAGVAPQLGLSGEPGAE